ncbi:MAG: Tryptophan synthase alpha chain [Actinomycetota bacterium]|nr:Tryptophan synthase alpha chain [Actinomycetota bacterium]
MTTLSDAFAAARADDRALLIGYLPAGFPTRTDAVAIIAAMVENGVDVVEVGLPYSDPLMDGPVIQSAVDQALAGGARIADVMAMVRATAAAGAPALVMSYWNPIEKYGVERFAAELADAGGVGVITPDLTPEESSAWQTATDAYGLDRVFLVAPSSTDARIVAVSDVTSGFVYAASTMGVTGVRTSVSGAAGGLVARVRAATATPVCVGLGVSTADQAAEVAAYADGVIVGSAFIRAVQEADSQAAARDAVGRLAAQLAVGVRRR